MLLSNSGKAEQQGEPCWGHCWWGTWAGQTLACRMHLSAQVGSPCSGGSACAPLLHPSCSPWGAVGHCRAEQFELTCVSEILALVTLPGQQQGLFLLPRDQISCTCLGGCESKAETPCACSGSLGCAQQLWGPAGRGGCVSALCTFSRSVVLCVVTGKLKVWEAQDQSSKHLTKHS